MNISENLQILNTAKQDIKAAIIEKGQTVGDNMHEYAEAIDNISGGGDDTDYLCFEAIEDSAVSLSNFGDNAPNIEYSYDKQTWTTWDYDNIDLPAGQKLYFRGDNENGFCTGDTIYSTFIMNGNINANGDLKYLLKKDGHITDGPDYCFRNLFRAQTAIQTAPKISLKYIGEMGCAAMFYQCTNLHYSPDIEIERYGYRALNYMFHSADLIFPPQFKHIEELVEGCFRSMFAYNTQLKSTPYLSPKTLVTGCYEGMFHGCTSLQYIKAEFTTTPSTTYTNNWVDGVASTGCFIKGKTATWTSKATYACPSGWTLITSVS